MRDALFYFLVHEGFLTHNYFILITTFSITGRQFDKDGNNINWWEPETDSTFRERAQCIIDQYGNYSIDDVGLQVIWKNWQTIMNNKC